MSDVAVESIVDLEARQLCPDGNCIGIIGADDRCNACGTELPEPVAHDTCGPDTGEGNLADNALEQTGFVAKYAEPEDTTPPDLDSRELCADGNCIGVVDRSTQACRECGRTEQQVAEDEANAAAARAQQQAESETSAARAQHVDEEAADKQEDDQAPSTETEGQNPDHRDVASS